MRPEDSTLTRAVELDDPQRLAAAVRLAETVEPSPTLDGITRLAARLLGTRSAQVSLLTDTQTVPSGVGIDPGVVGQQTPRAESLCAVTVSAGHPLVVGDAPRDRRVSALPPVASGQVGAYLGVPLVDSGGQVVGALCVHHGAARPWADSDVLVLEELAAAAAAELERAALERERSATQLRLTMGFAAAGVGSFDLDVRTGRLTWDDRLLDIFGFEQGTFPGTLDAVNVRVHPDDLPAVSRAIADVLERGAELDEEYRIVLPDGSARWVAARGRALLDADGRAVRVLGAAYDTTQVHEGDARVARVLESMSAAFFALDRSWRFTYVNGEAERLLGHPRDALLGGNLWELFPAALGTRFEQAYRAAMDGAQPAAFEEYYPAPLDAWYEVRAWPGPDGLSVYFTDVTQRRAVERQAAEATALVSLLARASDSLSGSLEIEDAVRELARLVVPALADWSIVSLVGADGRLHDLQTWHADPVLRPVVEEFSQTREGADTRSETIGAKVLRTGTPAFLSAESMASASASLRAPGATALGRLAPTSSAVIPLRDGDTVAGVLNLVRGAPRPPLSTAEVGAALDVARRAGQALANARTYARQRDMAEELQRSLLTAPVQPDHVHIVARYVPAASAAQVGGDWYDAFLQPSGATVLVIGDVVGHDTASAAAMGQLRSLLRGIAYSSGAGPASILTQVDEAIRGLALDTSATSVVARLEQDPDEIDEGVTTLRWSTAGHPPPLLLHTDGIVEQLDGGAMMLGVGLPVQRSDRTVVLDRGTTVVMYTDGLVERRGEDIDQGIDRLRSILSAAGDVPLDDLADHVLDAMRPERPDDDVALLLVRLHRQDRPRPASAGPVDLPPGAPDDPADPDVT